MSEDPGERKRAARNPLLKGRQIRRRLEGVVGGAKEAVLNNVTSEKVRKSMNATRQGISWVGGTVSSGLQGLGAYTKATATGLGSSAKGLVVAFSDHDRAIEDLEDRIVAQGGLYQELVKNRRLGDTLFVGGESLAVLLAAGHIPQGVIEAYEAAYPQMSQTITFEDKVRSLDEASLPGFLSAVKGKLFEQQYVDYLNGGNLPDGFEATLATSATQPGWDISVEGPDPELASVIQAKATDSVSYVVSGMQQNPAIDVVTTEEVYSHLVLSGVSEGIVNSGIANADLVASLEAAADATDIGFDFLPPWFTLAFIAFTSYKAESLSIYQRLELAGNRTGQAYLAYLIGSGVAAVTNTWWLGVLSTVSSRFLSEARRRKAGIRQQLHNTYETNRRIVRRLQALPKSANPMDVTGTY